MQFNNTFISPECGFTDTYLAIFLKPTDPEYGFPAMDNLWSRGSDKRLGQLKRACTGYVRTAAIRDGKYLSLQEKFDFISDTAAEPNALAGT